MATVRTFRHLDDRSGQPHRTDVECGWFVLNTGTGRLLQLDTYGSDDRALPGKVSQTLQLDQDAAAELLLVLRIAFPSL
jgi:hypothetical protein